MSVIGMFTPTKDGGWIGNMQTLIINTKLRFVPNDDRASANAPAFRVYIGQSRIGDAWEAQTDGDTPRDYLRVRLYDPSLAEPIGAALLIAEDGKIAHLVWNRRRAS